MAGGTPRRHGLRVHGGRICWSARGSRARGLLRLALMALRWCGDHGVSRRGAAAAAMMWSRIEPRLLLAISERINAVPGVGAPGVRVGLLLDNRVRSAWRRRQHRGVVVAHVVLRCR
jgi:hypothetical protein